MPSSWFQSGIDRGTIITLDQPVPSQWQIVEKLNEHHHQRSQAQLDHYRSGHSFASVKLLCRDPTNHAKKVFMRIYQQLPFLNTEFLDADARAKQATQYTPPELTAYQKLTQQGSRNTPRLLGYKVTTQDTSGFVPNGFAIYLAWEKVPGLRLGDKRGPDPFWALDRPERDAIRASFVKELLALMQNGYLNDSPALSSLVWHKASNTVYFIGFQMGSRGQLKGPFMDLEWIEMYGLAVPPRDEGHGPRQDADTSGWKF